jgi:hypothetical protein
MFWSTAARLVQQPPAEHADARRINMEQRNTAVRTMIQLLQDACNETLDALYDLPEGYLQEGRGHACARGGSARDLLVHNIVHEKQHTGQVRNIRDELRLLQGWGTASLYPLLVDYYLSRAHQLVRRDARLTVDSPEVEGVNRGAR